MALSQTTFAANSSVLLGNVTRRRGANNMTASFIFSGGFGGGTAVIQISLDGGVTKTTVRDTNGADLSVTAAGQRNWQSGDILGNLQNAQIYATLSGATAPTLNVAMMTNQ